MSLFSNCCIWCDYICRKVIWGMLEEIEDIFAEFVRATIDSEEKFMKIIAPKN